jgi:hypothetical protein
VTNNDFADTREGRLKRDFVALIRKYLGAPAFGNTQREVDDILRRHSQAMARIYQFDPVSFPPNGPADAKQLFQFLIDSLTDGGTRKSPEVKDLFEYKYQASYTLETGTGPKPLTQEPKKREAVPDTVLSLGVAHGRRDLTRFTECLDTFRRIEFDDFNPHDSSYGFTDRDLPPGRHQAFKTQTVTVFPKYLVIYLHRGLPGERLAHSHRVDVPEVFDFGSYFGTGPRFYHLNSRINYDGGHYTADVYARDGRFPTEERYSWVNCNDSRVRYTGDLDQSPARGGLQGLLYVFKAMSGSESQRYQARGPERFHFKIDQLAEAQHRRSYGLDYDPSSSSSYDDSVAPLDANPEGCFLYEGRRCLHGRWDPDQISSRCRLDQRSKSCHYQGAPPQPSKRPLPESKRPSGDRTAPVTTKTRQEESPFLPIGSIKGQKKTPLLRQLGEHGGCRFHMNDCHHDATTDEISPFCVMDRTKHKCYPVRDIKRAIKNRYPTKTQQERNEHLGLMVGKDRIVFNHQQWEEFLSSLGPQGL